MLNLTRAEYFSEDLVEVLEKHSVTLGLSRMVQKKVLSALKEFGKFGTANWTYTTSGVIK